MGQQFTELLLEVSRKLAGTERLLGEAQETNREQSREIGELRERVATLENDLEWIAEARRKVDGRLETGDQTFKRIEAKAEAAERVAKWCREQLQKAQQKETKDAGKERRKFLYKLLEHAAPMIVGFLFWLLYHLLLVGPKIAEAMKPHLENGGGH